MNKVPITMIAAVAENLAIGKNGNLLWNIPEDLKHFSSTTRHHVIIMGYRTFEEVGKKPLPNRTNIVLTKEKDDSGRWLHSLLFLRGSSRGKRVKSKKTKYL